MKKLPDDAFAVYLAMGPRRSHDAVSKQFGVDKKTVTNRAIKENWKERVAEHERKIREESEKKAHESLGAMDDRQLKVSAYIQGKAIETLKSMPLDSAMDAVKAYKLAVEMERMIRSQLNRETAADIEEKIRGEHERWLVPDEEDATDNAPAGGDEPQVEQSPAVEEPGANESASDDQPKVGETDGETTADGGSNSEAPVPAV